MRKHGRDRSDVHQTDGHHRTKECLSVDQNRGGVGQSGM
jgi:hypothetical protein